MITRTSNQQATRTFINQLFQQQSQLAKVREEIATGEKVSDPSDDPGRAGTIAQFQSTLNRLESHKSVLPMPKA